MGKPEARKFLEKKSGKKQQRWTEFKTSYPNLIFDTSLFLSAVCSAEENLTIAADEQQNSEYTCNTLVYIDVGFFLLNLGGVWFQLLKEKIFFHSTHCLFRTRGKVNHAYATSLSCLIKHKSCSKKGLTTLLTSLSNSKLTKLSDRHLLHFKVGK